MTNEDVRDWANGIFAVPEKFLIELLKFEQCLIEANTPENIRTLRSPRLKKEREMWQAAIFSYGLSKTLPAHNLRFRPYENSDFDFIISLEDGNEHLFTAVQLKKIPSHKERLAIDIQGEISKLKRYTNPELTIAIFISRNLQKLDLSRFDFSGIKVREVWAYGFTNPQRTDLFLIGDLLDAPTKYKISMPSI